MASPHDDAEIELQGLLENARSPTLNRDRARRIRERARKIAAAFPSQRVAALVTQIEIVLREVFVDPDLAASLSRRIRPLADELAKAVPATPARVREALRTCGFTAEMVLELREAQELSRLISKPLQELRDKYDELIEPERLKTAVTQLEELLGFLPEGVSTARNFVAQLIATLRTRCEDFTARLDLKELLQKLRTTVREQAEPEGFGPLVEQLEANSWATAHPEDVPVQEGRRLARQLGELREAYLHLERLPTAVAECLERDQIRPAIDKIRKAQKIAADSKLVHFEPLSSTAKLFIRKLETLYQGAARAAKKDRDPTVERLQERMDQLSNVRDWLRRLPAELRGGSGRLEQQCSTLAHRQADRLQELVLSEHRDALRRLPVERLQAHAKKLQEAAEAVVQDLGRKLERLSSDLEAVLKVEDDVDESILGRLERARTDLVQGPVTDEALRLAEDYRNALRSLANVESEVERGDARPAELLEQIRPITARFPVWRRAHSLEKRVQDVDLLRDLKKKAKEGSKSDLRTALRMAAKISDVTLRQRFEGALGQLERASSKVGHAVAAKKSLRSRKQPDRLEESIDATVRAVDGFLQLAERTDSEISKTEFPKAWQALERDVTELVMSELPNAATRWLDLAVAATEDQEGLGQLRSRFEEWLEVVDDEFLRDRGGRVLRRRGVELDLDSLTSQNDFDEALRLLNDHRDVFEAEEWRQLETRLSRARAVDRYRRGDDADLAQLMRTVRRYGLSSELLESIVDHFRETGAAMHLAELARSREHELEDYEAEAILAHWCLDFQREELGSLAKNLASARQPTALQVFLDAAPHLEPGSKALYLLHRALSLEPDWPGEITSSAQDRITLLRDRISDELGELAATLKAFTLESQGDEAPTLPKNADDSVLRQELRRAFETAQAFIEEATLQFERWEPFLNPADRWLRSTDIIPKLRPMLEEIGDFERRLHTSQEVLDDLARAKDDVLENHPESLDTLKSPMMLGLKSIGLVQHVFALINQYFRDWHRALTTVRELAEVHREGGVGLSSEKLKALRDELEHGLRYDFRPEYDRFNLLVLLGDRSYITFVEELSTMVREVEAVERYDRRCRALMTRVRDQLELRLAKFQSEKKGAARESHRSALDALLDQADSEGLTLRSLYADPPHVASSHAASEHLEVLRKSDWYELLRSVESAASA